jgi:hypothetical protein
MRVVRIFVSLEFISNAPRVVLPNSRANAIRLTGALLRDYKFARKRTFRRGRIGRLHKNHAKGTVSLTFAGPPPGRPSSPVESIAKVSESGQDILSNVQFAV